MSATSQQFAPGENQDTHPEDLIFTHEYRKIISTPLLTEAKTC